MAMEQILNNIYRIAVPLPKSPLRELGCYLIKGEKDERNLIIDCGFNHDECEKAVREAMAELNLTMDNTDIFLTHLHADHSGLCGRLKTNSTKVFIRDCDGIKVNGFLTDAYWQNMMAWQTPMGVPQDELLDYHGHPAYLNRVDHVMEFTSIKDGDKFNIGGYKLEVVDLAGHTPGQLGLWCMEHGFLFGGDHVLPKITPNICIWDYDNDYLEIYLRNLRKVKSMSLKCIYPAHRMIITEVDTRIDELLLHHENRCNEICNLLIENGESTIWQLAKGMKWDFGSGKFVDFAENQKWFGSLEVFAHVEHLTRIEKISCNIVGKTRFYSFNK